MTTPSAPDWKTYAAAHSWADAALFTHLVAVMAEQGIPFCPECQDWHQPDRPHSTLEE